MGFCHDCPRRSEKRSATDIYNPAGRTVETMGNWETAKLIFVVPAPSTQDLAEGVPLSHKRANILLSALLANDLTFDDAFITSRVNCYPNGKDAWNRPVVSPTQRSCCEERFFLDLEMCRGPIVITMGELPFRSLLDVGGNKNGLVHWSGYIIPPKDTRLINQYLLPTFDVDFIRFTKFKHFDWLVRDIKTALEFAHGKALWSGHEWSDFDTKKKAYGVVAADTETSRQTGAITDISFATVAPDWQPYADSYKWNPSTHRATQRVVSRANHLVFHNLPFDYVKLLKSGIVLPSTDEVQYHDTMLCHNLLFPDSLKAGLNEIAPRYIGPMERWKHKGAPHTKPKPPKIKTWKRSFTCSQCNVESTSGTGVRDERSCDRCSNNAYHVAVKEWEKAGSKYNRTDSAVLLPIFNAQWKELQRTNQVNLFQKMQRAQVDVLIPMMIEGIKVDVKVRDRLYKKYEMLEQRILMLWNSSKTTDTLNPFSVPDVSKFLRRVGLKYHSTDFETLNGYRKDRSIAAPIRRVINQILALRRLHKWRSTYLAIGTRIYPRYAPAGKDDANKGTAATGRILAKGDKDTNTSPLQTIPKPMRDVLVSENGVFIQADYDSQELRLNAYMAGEKRLIKMLENGDDIHEFNRKKFGIDRVRAKNLFYGAIYGASPKALQLSLAAVGYKITQSEAKDFLAFMKKTYPRIYEWHDRLKHDAKVNGYSINGFGRRRPIISANDMTNEILNTPGQSTGSDILWEILLPVYKLCYEGGGSLKMLVHDSVVCDMPKEALTNGFIPALKKIMEQRFDQVAPGFWCPVSIETGTHWGSLTPLEVS